MGGRKESLKKALGITEYPWSSDEDEDSGDQRANTNTQESQATTSQQRLTNESRTKTIPYRTLSPIFYGTVPQLPETNNINPRQTITVTQQMDCVSQPYNVDRFRSYHNRARQNGPPSPLNQARWRVNHGIESRRISADVQRLLSVKKLARRMLRQKNRPPTSITMSSRSSPRNRAFVPSIPDLARNIHNRIISETRMLNTTNDNDGSLFTFNNADVTDELASSSSHMHQTRIINIKVEENNEPNRTPDTVVPNVNIGFSDNDAENTVITRPDRNENHIIQENLEDPTLDSVADTITLERGVIENPEDFITNANDNIQVMDVDRNANEEPSPSTSTTHATNAEAQATGTNRRRDEPDQNGETITVKELNQGLLRLLECPVCLDWMEPPISQCRRGHLVCGRCQIRLSACPVCRSMFSSVRNRAIEGVAEMLRYPCRHGCGREIKLRRRCPHETNCPARKYHCPAINCIECMPMPYSELGHHFQIKHFSMLIIGKKHSFSVKANAEQLDNWLIMAFDEFFYLRVDVDFPTWGIFAYVSYIGPKCKASNFVYEVRLDGQHYARKIVYTRVTHSDLESSSLNLRRQDCFHLNLDQALNFLRFKNRHFEPEKFLKFHVEISRISDVANSDS